MKTARFKERFVQSVVDAAEDHGHAELAANIRKAIDKGKLVQVLAIVTPVAIALLMGAPVDWVSLAKQIAALFAVSEAPPATAPTV